MGVKEHVSEVNEEMLFADGFENALIGYVERFGQPPLALYDRRKCILILMVHDGMSGEEAENYFEFNTLGAWMGENTPAFATLVSEGGDVDGPPSKS